MYQTGYDVQINRISRNCKIEKYDNTKDYECDICICATSWGGYPENIKSTKNEYWQMIHANYQEMAKKNYTYRKWEKTTKHICVSKKVKEIFDSMYNENSIVLYNLLDDIKTTKLNLISATRLSSEKGYNRMLKMIEMLKNQKIDFEWKIFTDLRLYQVRKVDYKEVKYLPTTFEIFEHIRNADYGVQLSDTER